MSRRQADLARRARREGAMTRYEFRAEHDEVVVPRASAGPTSPVVREVSPEIRAQIDAALARSNGKREAADG